MVARLHHERIGTAARALLVTHGIFGTGANWRSIARKLVAARPDWAVELVDLRQHGRSEPGEPPHTLAAAARDVRALLDELPDIVAVAGHSFGGKTMLALRAIAPARLEATWIFDASPSTRDGVSDPTVARVLEALERLPKTWAKRDDFVAALAADGHATSLAQWLAMNLVPGDGGLVLRLDLVAIRAMITDYAAQDLWDVLLDPALPGEVDVVIAERSPTFSAADRARLETVPPHVHVMRIDAGHWLHIDAPDAVVSLLATKLSGR
jgi:pimeloyl-ACP methyl ester carboxylesterase